MTFTERSRPAREAILAAARDEFGTLGFDRTTIRAVAARAGADPAMVMRYYGNKESLFAAAVDVDLALPPIMDPTRLGIGLAERFVELWEGQPSGGTLRILVRSAATSPAVAERVRTIFADQVAVWVGTAVDGPPARVSRCAGRIAAYVLGMALCRYVLALAPVAALSQAELVAEMGSVLQLLLDN